MLTEKIQYVMDIMKQNQFLTGGVAAVGFSFFLNYSKTAWQNFTTIIRKATTSELTITTRHSSYQAISKLAHDKRLSFFCRTYSLSFKASNRFLAGLTEDVDADRGKILDGLRPGFGTTIGIYKGKLFWFTKSMLENKNDIEEKIEIVFLTRKKKYIEEFIVDAMRYSIDESVISVYNQSHEYWGDSISMTKRNMNTVFVNNNIKETLIKRIDAFSNNKKWYIDRGIPYKLCIMLHGKPGSGKTSIIKALASHFSKNIYCLKDTKQMSEQTLSSIDKNTSIILLEDIDTMYNLSPRDNEGDKEKSDASKQVLHNLLNLFDGLSTPEGAIFILTTNHIKNIDQALFRPGRVDILMEMNELDKDSMIKMFNSFYMNNKVDFDNVEYISRTGAELQKIFLEETESCAIERLREQRKSISVEDLTDKELNEIAESKMDKKYDVFNEELDSLLS